MWQRAQISRLGWNKDLQGREPSVDDLKFDNFFKEIYLDSDTKVALLTNAPSDAPADWMLPQENVFFDRAKVNREAARAACSRTTPSRQVSPVAGGNRPGKSR